MSFSPKPCILIVEGERSTAMVWPAVLSREGCRPIWVEDGEFDLRRGRGSLRVRGSPLRLNHATSYAGSPDAVNAAHVDRLVYRGTQDRGRWPRDAVVHFGRLNIRLVAIAEGFVLETRHLCRAPARGAGGIAADRWEFKVDTAGLDWESDPG